MRNLIFIISIFFLPLQSIAQGFYLNDSSIVRINEDGNLYSGNDSQLNGKFENLGTFNFGGDLFTGNNRSLGDITLSGTEDQTIFGDTLTIGKLKLVKEGKLFFSSNRVQVLDTFDVQSGLFENAENEGVAFSGYVTEGSEIGHVEGRLVRFSTGERMIFPLGINGAYNEIIIENVPENQIVIVDCRVPSGNSKELPGNIVDIADEVEWQIRTLGDSIPVNIEVFYNGINLENESGLNADGFTPAIAYTRQTDTTYFALESASVLNPNQLASNEIVSDEEFYITSNPTTINIALVPGLSETVIYVPNAFSPNAVFDENKTFRAFFASPERTVSSVRVIIYDSFRNEIFNYIESGEDIELENSAWNGVLPSGQIAEEGIYYYIIKIIDDLNQVETRTGSFLLTN